MIPEEEMFKMGKKTLAEYDDLKIDKTLKDLLIKVFESNQDVLSKSRKIESKYFEISKEQNEFKRDRERMAQYMTRLQLENPKYASFRSEIRTYLKMDEKTFVKNTRSLNEDKRIENKEALMLRNSISLAKDVKNRNNLLVNNHLENRLGDFNKLVNEVYEEEPEIAIPLKSLAKEFVVTARAEIGLYKTLAESLMLELGAHCIIDNIKVPEYMLNYKFRGKEDE